jgi:uncharacterized membrane protein
VATLVAEVDGRRYEQRVELTAAPTAVRGVSLGLRKDARGYRVLRRITASRASNRSTRS